MNAYFDLPFFSSVKEKIPPHQSSIQFQPGPHEIGFQPTPAIVHRNNTPTTNPSSKTRAPSNRRRNTTAHPRRRTTTRARVRKPLARRLSAPPPKSHRGRAERQRAAGDRAHQGDRSGSGPDIPRQGRAVSPRDIIAPRAPASGAR